MTKKNNYADVLGEAYEAIPKAVFAAIVVSFANVIANEDFDKVRGIVFDEWQKLYFNQIVSQPVPKSFRKEIPKLDFE